MSARFKTDACASLALSVSLLILGRGFGFVAYSEEKAADAAFKAMDQAEIGGRTINVKFAKQREARSGGFKSRD